MTKILRWSKQGIHRATRGDNRHQHQSVASAKSAAVAVGNSAAFVPFYSVTKDPGRGMGLSAVKSSLEIAGGTIDIESAPGVGTNVTVFLPIAVEHTLKSATTAETYSV